MGLIPGSAGLVRGITHRIRLGPVIATAALASVILLVHAITLRHYPVVSNDEGNEARMFWSLIVRNAEVARGVDAAGVGPAWDGGVFGLSVSLALHTLGLGPVQGRAASLLWGIVLLVAAGNVTSSLYGRRLAVLVVLALAISKPFVVSSHTIRPEIAVTALGMAAIGTAITATRRRSALLALGAGLLLGLAVGVHLIAIVYAPVAVLFFIWPGAARWTHLLRLLLAAGLGGVIGLLPYLYTQVLRDINSSLQAQHFWLADVYAPPISFLPPADLLLWESYRWFLFIVTNQVETVLVGAGVAMALLVRDSRTLLLLRAFLVVCVGFILLAQNKEALYILIAYPLVVVLACQGWWSVVAQLQTGVRAFAAFRPFQVALGVLILSLGARWFSDLQPALAYDYADSLAPVIGAVPKGAVVFAEPVYWFALADNPLITFSDLRLRKRLYGTDLLEAIQEYKAEIVIFDRFVQWYVLPDRWHWQGVLREDLLRRFYARDLFEIYFEDYLERHASRLVQHRDRFNGHITVYRLTQSR